MAHLIPFNASTSDDFVQFVSLIEEKDNGEDVLLSTFGYTADKIQNKGIDAWHQTDIKTPKENI
ncbi:hypothetical protein D5018_21390 [Parashewanella curva]|uniref:Uncharacterized protein n=1 Tax=Parashewanella curva TaxID=2338552 RepID=A0A3L8PUF6_9GAMM|nr:hypothetical protein [Parashewanella curva]RLV57662.1 hypothetical protein D5018_21390 [Parashewanella curva]